MMTVAKEMNSGVALLLERMKTNPEEFVIEEGVVGKWDSLVRSYEGVLPPEDVKEYKQALNTLLQQQFTEKVLEELVDPKKSDRWVSQTFTSNTPLGGQIQLQSSAQQRAVQAHQAHVALHQQALGALSVNSATQSIGYGAGATNLLKNIFGGSK